jgi:hypothetical protein
LYGLSAKLYAALMRPATVNETIAERWREQPQIMHVKSKVATNSLNA